MNDTEFINEFDYIYQDILERTQHQSDRTQLFVDAWLLIGRIMSTSEIINMTEKRLPKYMINGMLAANQRDFDKLKKIHYELYYRTSKKKKI